MKPKAVFYHAGCPVCLEAERVVDRLVDRSVADLEIVHLGTARERIAEARAAGVSSVPALVADGSTLHLNFGASLDVLS
ncbi:thioredoxin family protein [Congregicoccus parvus]|uniref:thioredoxin family protein n=1 Tax=Congregicoccus parvus TaxID=3081749 RepID=UPI003FA5601A